VRPISPDLLYSPPQVCLQGDLGLLWGSGV